MGSKKSNAVFCYIDKHGNFVQLKEILNINITFPDMDVTWERMPTEGKWSCYFALHYPRSRKRFVKYLMGRKGYSRNEANALAESYHRHGYTWEQAFLDLALWSV